MKMNLSLAVVAAVAMAVAASPSEAASKKKVVKSSKAAKVTVAKSSPAYWASSANVCFSNAATWWFPIAAIGSVGCGIVYAIPVGVEGFVVRQGGSKA